MTKDPHPDPPLRALPEHSVLEDEGAPHPTLSGRASPHGLGGFDGTPNHSRLPHQQPVTSTSTFDFAQSMSANDNSASNTTSAGQQIQSGKMTFTLPDFGQDNGGAAAAPREAVLSPTQPQDKEGEELSIPGAFEQKA